VQLADTTIYPGTQVTVYRLSVDQQNYQARVQWRAQPIGEGEEGGWTPKFGVKHFTLFVRVVQPTWTNLC